ncbi:putative BPI/LBP family protein At1g04970 [Dendronephthya gigantea]|uniref:putative BPI/LBP family protein At1g04970 n=1 Tax=Dendronephthya gigantea TaxID=151771 RepID=UPI00106949F6|nr:putative BPI/LBP family protein At1g04970 [Dendronephthya gigantea]
MISSNRIAWIFRFLNCFIFLTASGVERPGVRSLLTTKGLDFVRKLALPIILKKLDKLEISPFVGNIDFFVGNVNYRFDNIKLSKVKIPESHISVINGTGVSVEGTKIMIKMNELWSYKISSWPFISDKGSATVSGKEISLNIILGVSMDKKKELQISAKDCSLNIGNLDINFRGGASFLYNLFMTLIKDPLKGQMEEIICRTAIKTVNDEINATLKTIPDETRIFNNTLISDFEVLRSPQFHENGIELDYKGEFINVKYPKTYPYKPEELPPISNEVSKMLYMWVTAYTINTLFYAVNQSESQQNMVYSKDLPDSVPVTLNTNYFMLIAPPLYQKYPNKDMAFGVRGTAPCEVTLKPNDGSITLFGLITFYVILDDNTLVDCFTLNWIELAHIDDVLIFRKDNNSYIGAKISSKRTDISLKESQIGNFDLTLLQFTMDVLSQFIIARYISPKAEEGFRLRIPKGFNLLNCDAEIGMNHLLISTDLE